MKTTNNVDSGFTTYEASPTRIYYALVAKILIAISLVLPGWRGSSAFRPSISPLPLQDALLNTQVQSVYPCSLFSPQIITPKHTLACCAWGVVGGGIENQIKFHRCQDISDFTFALFVSVFFLVFHSNSAILFCFVLWSCLGFDGNLWGVPLFTPTSLEYSVVTRLFVIDCVSVEKGGVGNTSSTAFRKMYHRQHVLHILSSLVHTIIDPRWLRSSRACWKSVWPGRCVIFGIIQPANERTNGHGSNNTAR